MKIGILTQPLRNNYGGLLQNYALQKVLKDAGHTPITLDQGDSVSVLRHKIYYLKCYLLHLLSPNKYKRPICLLSKEEESVIRKNTMYFIDKYISHTKVLRSVHEISTKSKEDGIQAFVVGSDQCWRASYNYHFPAMFLNFVEKKSSIRKIAYAASFGIDTWELGENQNALYRKWASDFDLITVREKSGVYVCKKFLGVDAYNVLDPTLLLAKSDYVQLIQQEKEPESSGNLFYYILDPTEEKKRFIDTVGEKLNLKPFMVLPKYKEEYRTRNNVENDIEGCVYPRVTQWLRAFMDAKMTIVDSFHGMVFSIIFNKPFWVIKNGGRGNTRFDSLLSTFGLEDRLIDDKDLFTIDIKKPIDWEKVNQTIDDKRKYSINLLLKYLK